MKTREKTTWTIEGTCEDKFLIEIIRWSSPAINTERYSKPLEWIWNVYAYIYEGHPLFDKFDFPSNQYMEKDISNHLDFHGRCTYLKYHYTDCEGYGRNVLEAPKKVSVQIGCDYNHGFDDFYRATKELERTGILLDAQNICDQLKSSTNNKS